MFLWSSWQILQDEAVPKAPSSLEQDVDGISPNQTEGNTSAAPSELRSPQNSTSSSSDIFAPIQRQPTLYFDADDGECVLDGLRLVFCFTEETSLTGSLCQSNAKSASSNRFDKARIFVSILMCFSEGNIPLSSFCRISSTQNPRQPFLDRIDL